MAMSQSVTRDSADGAAADRRIEFDYDSNMHLPETISSVITGSTDHETHYTWDYLLVLPLSETAVGGLTTSWQYDVFGRRTREDRPDGTHTTFTVDPCPGCLTSNTNFWAGEVNSGRHLNLSILRLLWAL